MCIISLRSRCILCVPYALYLLNGLLTVAESCLSRIDIRPRRQLAFYGSDLIVVPVSIKYHRLKWIIICGTFLMVSHHLVKLLCLHLIKQSWSCVLLRREPMKSEALRFKERASLGIFLLPRGAFAALQEIESIRYFSLFFDIFFSNLSLSENKRLFRKEIIRLN